MGTPWIQSLLRMRQNLVSFPLKAFCDFFRTIDVAVTSTTNDDSTLNGHVIGVIDAVPGNLADKSTSYKES